MPDPILTTTRLVKRFGGLIATDEVSLEIPQNELHAIIGPNGAGKTTLIAQLAGELKPDSGSIHINGEDVTDLPAHVRAAHGLARSFQTTSVFLELTALENTQLAVQAHAGHSFRFWRPAHSDPRLREPACAILERVGLIERATVSAAHLSHGERRVLEIAMALATQPRLLLLDEPMAGMGSNDASSMIKLLRELKGTLTILLVEHDMDTVFALADRITVLVYGRTLASGTPDAIRGNAGVREAYLGEEAPRRGQ